MIVHPDFPRLTGSNHRVTSPPSTDYNCIAWSAGDTAHWWQPGVYWPTAPTAGDYSLGVLQQAFLSLGYTPCADGSLESGFEKVALYGDGLFYTHAARQLEGGRWTSKLGQGEDIEHDTADDVGGGLYGEVEAFLRRRVSATA